MELFLIDAIGPFFRGRGGRRTNWSKIPFPRIKTSFDPLPVGRRVISIGAGLLLRRKRGYRLLDRLLVLHLSGPLFRVLQRCEPGMLPKFLRKSAMGVDTLFK